jgi:3-dehydroquinate dehydratase/shikimate dehydrogenase
MMIKTARLTLRPWRKEDLEPFGKLNADPRVMEYFPAVKSREESDQTAFKMQEEIDRHGWGFWAASLKQTDQFIGFIGIGHVNFTEHFTPAVEIGWRLAFEYWGKGYATEGAKASLKYGFEMLNLQEIVSFTPVQNSRSRRVMEKIGMHHHSKDDFDHPKLPENHPLRRHVLYRLQKEEWKNSHNKDQRNFHFAPVTPDQRTLIHGWFGQKHIKEWLHGEGLQNTLNGLEKSFQESSETTYWIGYDSDTPFAFLITSPEGIDAATLDLFICDLNYVGKGLAVSMIKEFLTTHFSHVKRVLIDPESTNQRAIHVYQKVGFKIVGEFIAKWHPVLHYQMELNVQDLLNNTYGL